METKGVLTLALALSSALWDRLFGGQERLGFQLSPGTGRTGWGWEGRP